MKIYIHCILFIKILGQEKEVGFKLIILSYKIIFFILVNFFMLGIHRDKLYETYFYNIRNYVYIFI